MTLCLLLKRVIIVLSYNSLVSIQEAWVLNNFSKVVDYCQVNSIVLLTISHGLELLPFLKKQSTAKYRDASSIKVMGWGFFVLWSPSLAMKHLSSSTSSHLKLFSLILPTLYHPFKNLNISPNFILYWKHSNSPTAGEWSWFTYYTQILSKRFINLIGRAEVLAVTEI